MQVQYRPMMEKTYNQIHLQIECPGITLARRAEPQALSKQLITGNIQRCSFVEVD